MSVLKGYTAKVKQSFSTIFHDLFATFQPIRAMQVGMDVVAHGWTRIVVADAAEATSTVNMIKATGHAARVGDVLHFTSGNLIGHEVKVLKVETDYIYLGEDIWEAPGAGDTFNICRHKYPNVNSDGDLNVSVTSSGTIAFERNGVNTTVTEDTVTPANSRPLPVKLMGVNGALSVTTDVLDISSTFATDSMDVSGSTVTAELSAVDNAVLDNIDSNTGSAAALLTTIDTNIASITSDIDALATASQRTVVGKTSKNMAVTNITDAAYVELVAATTAITYKVQIFEGFGAPLIFAVGAAGAEFDTFIIPPGGTEIECIIPSGRRLSVKAVSGTSNSGYIVLNLVG